MYCVYVLKNLKSKRFIVGYANNFEKEFEKYNNTVLVSLAVYGEQNKAEKHKRYLESKKGMAEFRAKAKKNALGIMG